MIVVSPDELHSCRVYFTQFDRVTYSQVAWTPDDVEEIKRGLERRAKLAALTQGHIVMVASHLVESELAHEVLLGSPRLFADGIIVPALPSEFSTVEEFRQARAAEGSNGDFYEGAEKRDIATWIDDTARSAIQWRAEEASGWLRQRLADELEGEHSLLSSHFRERGVPAPRRLAEQVRQMPEVGRTELYLLAKSTGDNTTWGLLSEYVDFLYYLSGALAVRSEGVLPQENLVEFTSDDFEAGRTPLSDMQVFFKLFIDVVKAATASHFPADLLDALSMDDVADLHHAAIDRTFVAKYGEIQSRTKEGLEITDPERLVLLASEIEEYQRELHASYRSAIARELPARRRDQRAWRTSRFLNSVSSLVVMPYGLVTGLRSILIDGLALCGKDDVFLPLRRRIEGLVRVLDAAVDRRAPADRPLLLDFVSRLKRRYVDAVERGEPDGFL